MSAAPLRRRWLTIAGTAAAFTLVLAGCTSNTPEEDPTSEAPSATVEPGGTTGNDEPGDKVVIGFSAPQADHGWIGAITKGAVAEAKKYSDVELKQAEGTNDVNVQISQIEGFINDKVDAIVLLPFDGAARTAVLGDNYGMGVSAGAYICDQLGGKSDAKVAEIAGIDSLPLTQDRSKGFADALGQCGLKVSNRVAADFTVQGGNAAAASLLQAAPKLDAIWNHDDDQGVGVLAAIEEAGRDEFFMVGGAGSKNVMEAIKADNTVLKATVIYPSTQAADGIKLARLLVQGKSMSDLVEVEVPRKIQLYAPVVTKENVDKYLPTAFES